MTTPSAIHHMLAILAGDSAADRDSNAPNDSLARLIGRLGWGSLAPAALDDHGDHETSPRFVRLTFPGIAPTDAFIVDVATAAGLRVESLADGSAASPRWLLIGPQSISDLSSAVAQLRATHRIHAVPFRQI